MMMMGIHFMGEPPFSAHLAPEWSRTARPEDEKVKGNVVDPLDVIGGATLEQLLAKADKSGAQQSGIDY